MALVDYIGVWLIYSTGHIPPGQRAGSNHISVRELHAKITPDLRIPWTVKTAYTLEGTLNHFYGEQELDRTVRGTAFSPLQTGASSIEPFLTCVPPEPIR